MDKFEKRIKEILVSEISHNKKNTKKYYHYLAKSIQLPCQLTGREDFPWEEPYVFGGWSKKEYEKLKKDKPSSDISRPIWDPLHKTNLGPTSRKIKLIFNFNFDSPISPP